MFILFSKTESPLQLNSSSITQSGPQLSSPLQLPRHDSSLDDRNKAPATSPNDVKPLLSSVGQPSAAPLSDASSIQKVCLVTSCL